MPHKDGRFLVRVLGRDELAGLAVHQQITRQAEDAAEFLRASDAAKDGDGAALREAAEHDARRGDAFGDLVGDEAVEVGARAQDSGFVVGLGEFGEGGLLAERPEVSCVVC